MKKEIKGKLLVGESGNSLYGSKFYTQKWDKQNSSIVFKSVKYRMN